MNTSTFFKEINQEITRLNDEYSQIEVSLKNIKKDEKAYLEHLYANKDYYQLCIDKFEVALRKAKLEAIRDGKEYDFKRFIRPVYLHKIDQFYQFKRHAPVVIK
ncbi:MAG: hypothetical protein IJP99_08455 [Methanobrevibacter sp.]|nr:hypothetical protein [Methanobrevibacter sp.]